MLLYFGGYFLSKIDSDCFCYYYFLAILLMNNWGVDCCENNEPLLSVDGGLPNNELAGVVGFLSNNDPGCCLF